MSADDENIIELLGPREVIGQAIGFLMSRHDVSRDAAFELLVQGSCGSRRKVREVAAEMLQQWQGPDESTGVDWEAAPEAGSGSVEPSPRVDRPALPQ